MQECFCRRALTARFEEQGITTAQSLSEVSRAVRSNLVNRRWAGSKRCTFGRERDRVPIEPLGLVAQTSPQRATPVRPLEKLPMTQSIAGIKIPDSALARATTEYIREQEDDLLFNHSRRVFLWGALTGERKGLTYDAEQLYVGAMFHDLGLVEQHRSADLRFEVDSANAARAFMQPFGLSEGDIEQVWLSIALHTTPGVPEHLRPNVALVTAGVEMDVLGINYGQFSDEQREVVTHAHPRGEDFKGCILCAFADGFRHKPDTTFGTVNADVLVDEDPTFKPLNFVEIIRQSAWKV